MPGCFTDITGITAHEWKLINHPQMDTNIPLEEWIDLAVNYISKGNPCLKLSEPELRSLFTVATLQTHFKFIFNGSFYDQIDGIAMGSPLLTCFCLTTVYCKKTFTGLVTNYFSFTLYSYKVGLIRTPVDRAYKITVTTPGWGYTRTLKSLWKSIILSLPI